MRLLSSRRRRAAVEDALAAYRQWSHECAGVSAAYHAWRMAAALDEPAAFDAYSSALDREEAAADLYARSISRAHGLVETGLALQLAPTQARFEA
jgi:hypothetical protein